MSASNDRVRDPDTIHHITSRIAHRVYFLGDDERNDLIEIARRAAEFCGIRLLAWCIMTNHFHLMVHLPIAIEVSEEEVLRRYGILKGASSKDHMAFQLGAWRLQGETGEALVAQWLSSQRRRMYNVGEFMKIVKQWFTEEYNYRHSHVGTLWESKYHDKPVKMVVSEMARRMGYVHLNPIRAAASATYDGYAWSSFAAFAKGDPVAVAGMRFVYDDEESSVEELKAQHIILLDELLEAEKRKRAEEIARKRAAGYELPADLLTSEAMIAQAAAHLEKVRIASAELRAATESADRKQQRALGEQVVLDVLRLHPSFSVEAIASAVGMAVPTVYKHLRALKNRKVITRRGRSDPWEFIV